MNYIGNLSKMAIKPKSPAVYNFILGDQSIELNPYLGKEIKLTFNQVIHCIYCDRAIKKTYNQGYCFPCSQKLARCDFCILKPERCHFHLGTCREPDWGEANCMIPHYVYFAVTSDLKVGITRKSQVPTRWLDQGATQALPIIEVKTRRQSGYVEDAFRNFLSDRTNWRNLLKGVNTELDLKALYSGLLQQANESLKEVIKEFGEDEISLIEAPELYEFEYPVLEYPTKIKSLGFDKMPVVEGTLMGMKGQYLIFDNGVINMRKHTGYEIELNVPD